MVCTQRGAAGAAGGFESESRAVQHGRAVTSCNSCPGFFLLHPHLNAPRPLGHWDALGLSEPTLQSSARLVVVNAVKF